LFWFNIFVQVRWWPVNTGSFHAFDFFKIGQLKC